MTFWFQTLNALGQHHSPVEKKLDCKEDTVSFRDLLPLLEFIKMNLQVKSITGTKLGPHSGTGSNEENQITQKSEMLD